jgi:hypothetical protein
MTPVLAALLVALLAGCGAVAGANHRPPHRSRAVTLRGSLVGVTATTLTVQQEARPGTVQVRFGAQVTPIYGVTAATSAVLQPGSCASVRGGRDESGTVTASDMVAALSVDGACPAGAVPDPPPAPLPSPAPPYPPPSASSTAAPAMHPVLLSGQVVSVGGRAVGIGGPQGDPQVVLLQPEARILFYQPAGPSALVVPSCVVVQGTRGAHGAIEAQKIVDWPTGTEC